MGDEASSDVIADVKVLSDEMTIGNLYILAIASGIIVLVLVFDEDTCNELVDSETDVSFSNVALFVLLLNDTPLSPWSEVGHAAVFSLLILLTLSVSLSSLSQLLSAPPPRNINGSSTVSSMSLLIICPLFLSSIVSCRRECCLRPGRVTLSANRASYNKPGIAGASSLDMSLTSAFNGPQGDNTANRSYNASMISNAHAIQSLKYDICHATITEDAIRYPCVMYVGTPFW